MTISTLRIPEHENLEPKITVFGVGGAGCNAVNNMIAKNLKGANFIVANTDAQSLEFSNSEIKIQLGQKTTQGLGAGSNPSVGAEAAEESREDIENSLNDSHMCFVTAGMGGGTGTGAAPVIAKVARDKGILTVGVVTKPFKFEGTKRMKAAEKGIEALEANVHTLIVVPNDNLFMVTKEDTTTKDAFEKADEVLFDGVKGITDLIVQPGLINLDFADVKTIMLEMGNAMMGCGQSDGDRKKRASVAANEAMQNRLLGFTSLKDAKGILINIIGGSDLTLFDLDMAASTVRENVDEDANVIVGSSIDPELEGVVRVSIMATGMGPVSRPRELTDEIFTGEIEPLQQAAAGLAAEGDFFENNSAEYSDAAGDSGESAQDESETQINGFQTHAVEPVDREADHSFWPETQASQEPAQEFDGETQENWDNFAQEPSPDTRYREFVAPKPIRTVPSQPSAKRAEDSEWMATRGAEDTPQRKEKPSTPLKIAGFLKKFADSSSQAISSNSGVRAIQPSLRGEGVDEEFDELRDVPAFARRQAN
ncbi:MAG: cell division protein FtsZ [Albidovulum sp.]|nr:cell division protein FtsZ [Albidovulum sp.]